MARYHGKGGVIYIGSAVGGAAGPVNGLSKWSIDATTDKAEVSAFQDANKVYVQGLPDLKGMLSGFWDDVASDTLYTASAAAGPVNMYLYPSSLRTNKYWYGVAFVDYSVDVEVKDAVKTSCNFVAGGSWGRL
jgi:hypothetical protein